MKFAYADPPYLGCGSLYSKHHADALDWNKIETHGDLLNRLCTEYPDGWCMSASSPSLASILPLCPPDVRVAVWVEPFAIYKPNVGVAYAWEPVIFRGGRRVERSEPTRRDWVAENITLKKGLTGAKPSRFCRWIIGLMNAKPGDDFDDLFPGTHAFGEEYQSFLNDGAVCIGGIKEKAT